MTGARQGRDGDMGVGAWPAAPSALGWAAPSALSPFCLLLSQENLRLWSQSKACSRA